MKWKKHLWIIAFIIISFQGSGQESPPSSPPVGDSVTVNNLLQQSKDHFNDDPVKAIDLAKQAKELAATINFDKGEAYALKNIGIVYFYQGKYVETLDFWNQSIAIFERINDDVGVANLLNNLGALYFNQGDNVKALDYYLKSLKISEPTN